MKKALLFPVLCCLALSFMFTACNREEVEDIIPQEQEKTYDHTELAKKMYSPDLLEGKGKVVDGELRLDVDLLEALTEEEKQSITDAGGLYINDSFNIPHEDAVRIWGEDAPIPAEGISFTPGTYESSDDSYRGCWVCTQCGCGTVVCTYYSVCIIIIVVEL